MRTLLAAAPPHRTCAAPRPARAPLPPSSRRPPPRLRSPAPAFGPLGPGQGTFRRWLLAFAVLLTCARLAAAEPLAFYINYSARVPTAPLVAHPLSIVHPDAQVDLAAAHAAGNTVLAYLSAGEVASDAPYRADVTRLGLPYAGRNAVWASDLVDHTDPRWAAFLVDTLAARAAQRGFDGFFLDTLDSVDLVAPGDPTRTAALRRGLVDTIRRLRAAFPQKRIVINRGFFAFAELRDTVDGVLVESVFETHDFGTKAYRAVPPAERDAVLAEVRKIRAAGRAVYALDYVDPLAGPERAFRTARALQAEGFHAFVSTPTLDGHALAPLRVVPRRICAFYGNRTTVQEDQVKWPMESFVGQKLQMPLEWLGYEVDYFKVESAADLPALSADYRAIVLSRTWEVAPAIEPAVVDWLIAQRDAGRKILVVGALPLRDPAQRERFLAAFGLGGTGSPRLRPAAFDVVTAVPGFTNHEVQLPVEPMTFNELRAPAGATRLVSLRARYADGTAVAFDPVFHCDWGGMALDPFVFFRRTDFREFWRLDPFAWLERALGPLDAPVPDTTTRDGLRVFLSHIDGDGFSNFSRVVPGQRSAEIIRDRILKKYPLPVTVSIIEAEIRARIRTQRADDAAAYETLARDIFLLPQVELASHSYSHPFYWIEGDRTQSFYDEQNLDLKDAYDRLDLAREIEGSVRYINTTLAPPGRPVRVFLWTGNCRPPPAAIALTRRLGLENMNGGDTLLSPRHPTLTAVSPRTMTWGDEVQVLAPNQNENVYTNNWRGPLFGTYVQVLDTFRATETPRRLKPVNVYYHFYSGDYPASLTALETVFDWVVAQPLHALTVSHYARIARDARSTTVFAAGPDRWLVVNAGEARTFRLPADPRRTVDLAQSVGVSGWHDVGPQTYLHTVGGPVATIVRRPAGGPVVPRLETATGEIAFLSRTPSRWSFRVADTRPVAVVIADLPPAATVTLGSGAAAREFRADATGRLRLDLPATGEFTVAFAPP